MGPVRTHKFGDIGIAKHLIDRKLPRIEVSQIPKLEGGRKGSERKLNVSKGKSTVKDTFCRFPLANVHIQG